MKSLPLESAFLALLETFSPNSKRLKDALSYVLSGQGKMLRARLVWFSGLSLGVDEKKLYSAALAIECVHTYSLVHDDLPAMDDDDFRRGKASCHKQFDEATAILVGDALPAMANLAILRSSHLSNHEKVMLCDILNEANSPKGIIDGQMLDLFPQGESQDDLMLRHRLKTGVLIEAAIKMALSLKPMSDKTQVPYLNFAMHLGLAFQIQDDFLDRYGNKNHLGKAPGSDKAQGKVTFADCFEKKALKTKITNHYQQAKDALLPLGPNGSALLSLCEEMANRYEVPA